MPAKISLTEQAYQQLRDDLLTCRLAPGDRLNIRELALARSVSPGAVREALARLISEGLVEADAARGFRVAAISLDDLRDLVSVRLDIESQCLRRSIACGDLEWEAGVAAANHRLSRTPVRAEGDDRINPRYAEAHAAFHEALVAACDSPWLLRLRGLLYAQSERYRSLTVPYARAERDLDHEHDSLAQAVLKRDADRAVAMLDEHLARTARTLIEAIGGGDAIRALVRPRLRVV